MVQRLLVCEYLSGGGGVGPARHAHAQADAESANAISFATGPAIAARAPAGHAIAAGVPPGSAMVVPAQTDGLDLLAQGLAMRDAMVADVAALPGIELACVQGPGVPRAAAGRVVELLLGESLLAFVRREAVRFDRVWVVAPESDGCLLALAQAVDARRWMGCLPAAIRLCSSKRDTLAHLAARDIATPMALDAQATRWVVKPDDSAGSVDTRVHATREAAQADLAERTAQGRAATLEPWVEGGALSLSLLIGRRNGDRSAAELLSVNRQRIAVDSSGMLAYRGVDILAIGPAHVRHAALGATAAAVARAVPGLRGFIGIDLVWHERCGPVVIEINPRLTCAYAGLSAALGRNLAGEMLALHDEEARAHARA